MSTCGFGFYFQQRFRLLQKALSMEIDVGLAQHSSLGFGWLGFLFKNILARRLRAQ